MTRAIRYHPEFYKDARDAADWYAQQSSNLGTDFLLRVQIAISHLADEPGWRTAIQYGLRYWPGGRLP